MKRISRIFLLAMLVTGILSATATVNVAEMTNVSSLPNCSTPPQVSSFTTAAASASAFFNLDNLQQGDLVAAYWIDPSGSQFDSSVYDPVAGEGTWCFMSTMSIAGAQAASKPGNWKVQIKVNGNLLATVPFTITGSTAGGTLHLAINQVDTSKCPSVTAGLM